ncbi:MAG: GNAT family protein [Roseovarius sp.]
MSAPRLDIPRLETARLILRAPRVEEFEAFAALVASERAEHMYRLGRKPAWKEFAAEMGHWPLFGFGPWHVERKSDGALLGAVSLLKHDHYPETEIGWHLFEGFEGHGYAEEAARAARDWAFTELGLETLVSYIDPANLRSIALAERLGAVRDTRAKGEDATDLVYRHAAPAERAAQ